MLLVSLTMRRVKILVIFTVCRFLRRYSWSFRNLLALRPLFHTVIIVLYSMILNILVLPCTFVHRTTGWKVGIEIVVRCLI